MTRSKHVRVSQPRRTDAVPFALASWIERTALRHATVALLAAFLVYLFGLVHGQWSPMHRWNKAAADASLLLLTVAMTMGPAARIWPWWRRLLPIRREFGVYAVLLALVHTLIILDGWIEWNPARLFGFAFHQGLGQYVMVQHGFGLANLIGVVALGYGFVLMMTSSDRAINLLGGSIWKFLQTGAYVLWMLVVVHTAYFVFMHFLDFHRPMPPPNPLRWAFVALVLFVFALRCHASVRTWRRRRREGTEPLQ
jgi:methionine sulfoxide reductase heme-binding subunit